MKKPITAIAVLIAILSISLPAMSQSYEPDFSEINKLGGPYDRDKNPQYYQGIEDYFEKLNEILLKDDQEKLSEEKKSDLKGFINVMNAYIAKANEGTESTEHDNLLRRDELSDDLKVFAETITLYVNNEKITPADQISDLKGFLNVINKYADTKLKPKLFGRTRINLLSIERSKRTRLTEHGGLLRRDELSDDLKFFAEAIALYVNNEKITSDILIKLESEDQKIKPNALIAYINELLVKNVMIKTNAEAFANVVINYIKKELGKRNTEIKDETIVTLHSDSPYGRETNNFLNQLAKNEGFKHEPKTEFEWSKPNKNIPFIFVRGGRDIKATIADAAKHQYPVGQLIGDEWSNVIDEEISEQADRYKAVTYLNEVEKDVHEKLGVWDAYTSIIDSDKLNDRTAINEACKKLLGVDAPCTLSGNDTSKMTEEIADIREWTHNNSDWKDI